MSIPIAIIGAGPAGMTAALYAARSGKQVTLIDSNAQVGRKLLVTGSGRANLTNRGVSPEKYASASDARPWLKTLFDQFGPDDLLKMLEEFGLLTFSTPDGWYYPVSESAQTVVAAFESALERAGVDLLLEHTATAIRKASSGFVLSFENAPDLTCEKLLIAAGGKAYPTLGSRGECFPALKAMGHTVRPLLPALGPLTCEMKQYQKLQGVRLDARAILIDTRPIAETTGNLIFTQWGLNGPAVMNLSHLVARFPNQKLHLRLNFLPYHKEAVRTQIQLHRNEEYPLEVIPCSSLPPKLTQFVLSQAGLNAGTTLKKCSDKQLETLMAWITDFPVEVVGVRDFDTCQVTAGGVPVDEVDPLTMQSKLVPGLYLAGETLDVVGPCGGYNLQFAFSTGAVAGMGMGKE
jgi:predicted Rossmann fold flavoprotein